MRLFYGAACGRLKERELGLSAVGRSCRCWRSAKGEKAGSVERGEGRHLERADGEIGRIELKETTRGREANLFWGYWSVGEKPETGLWGR